MPYPPTSKVRHWEPKATGPVVGCPNQGADLGPTLWDLSPRVDGQCEICGFYRHGLCGCEDGWHHSRLGRSQIGWEFLHSARGAGTKLGSWFCQISGTATQQKKLADMFHMFR